MVKMTSFEVIHSDKASNEGMESADFSFLPLPPSMSPELEATNYNVRNLQSALISATQDLTMEDVHHRLLDMLQENEELKEALKKNNVMMQEQLSIVSSWHEQMLQAKNKQQSKLEEAKNKISELQKENERLNLKIKELDIQIAECTKEEACLKCEHLETVTSSLEVEKENLLKEKNDLSTEFNQQKLFLKQLENKILSVSSCLEHLQNNSKLLVEEKRELIALNNELQVQLSSFNCCEPVLISDVEFGYTVISHANKEKATTDALKDALMQLHELEEKVTKLSSQLEEKDKEISSLKIKTLEQEEKLVHSEEEKKNQEEAVKASYEITQSKLDMESSLAQKYKDRCDSLQQHMDDYQAKLEQIKLSDSYIIEKLREEVRNLQEVLKFEQTTNEADKKKLEEAAKTVKLLSEDINTANKLLQIQEQEQNEKSKISDSTKEEENKKHFEEIDVLTAKLMYMEQELEAQTEKVKALTSELDTVNEDSESIPILKAQVEVYKVDFHKEKEAKDLAQNMVGALEQKVKMLEDQLSSITESPSLGARRSPRRRSGAEGGQGISEPFSCPFCSNVFQDLKSVENHANRCADNLPK